MPKAEDHQAAIDALRDEIQKTREYLIWREERGAMARWVVDVLAGGRPEVRRRYLRPHDTFPC